MKRLSPYAALVLTFSVAACDGQKAGRAETQARTKTRPAAEAAPLSRPPLEAVRPERLIRVRPGEFATWSFKENPRPVGYRMGDMTIIVRGPAAPASGSGSEAITRQIRIRAPGRADHVQENDFVGAWTKTRLTHGQLEGAGTAFLLVATALGGSQVCEEIELFILRSNRTEHVELGPWDVEDGSKRAGTCPPGPAELRAFVRKRGYPI